MGLLINFVVSSLTTPLATNVAEHKEQATVIYCKFEKLPVMEFVFRGGMGTNDNTVRIGHRDAVPLSVGSGLMVADTGAQEFVFSLRLPPSVTITNQGSVGTQTTYYGECTPPVAWDDTKSGEDGRAPKAEVPQESEI